MVTIEQKLALFSKLLKQDVKNSADEKLAKLNEEYEEKMEKSKLLADKEAQGVIDRALKNAELKKIEIISKSKMNSKKEIMLAKEKCIHIFMEKLKLRISHFTDTEAYKNYLGKLIETCDDLKGYPNKLIIYTTQKDNQQYSEYIKAQFAKLGIDDSRIMMEIKEDSMLGGIMVEDLADKMRVDLSIAALLEESETHIIEAIFEAIGEAGELDE